MLTSLINTNMELSLNYCDYNYIYLTFNIFGKKFE